MKAKCRDRCCEGGCLDEKYKDKDNEEEIEIETEEGV